MAKTGLSGIKYAELVDEKASAIVDMPGQLKRSWMFLLNYHPFMQMMAFLR